MKSSAPFAAALALGLFFTCAVQAAGFDYEILSQPGQLTTEAHDFNSQGAVVGISQTPDFQLRPFVYKGGEFKPLELPTTPPILSITGINDRNHMVGYVNRLDYTVTSALFGANGVKATIEVPGAIQTFAYSINERDQVAGSYDHSNGTIFTQTSGFLFDKARGYRTFDAPGAGTLTIAWGMNNRGDAVGVYADRAFVYHGFVRRSDGSFRKLDYPGSAYTQLMGINDRGDIVGLYQDDAGTIHGFCQCGDRFEPLAPPGATMTYPYNVDKDGRVVGWFISDSGTFGFIATPR